MLKWIRGARLDMKTGIAIILLSLIVWGVMIYVNVRDFVPEELTQPTETRQPVP